jgi:poly(3-hydroxybutyrate) depolymerase
MLANFEFLDEFGFGFGYRSKNQTWWVYIDLEPSKKCTVVILHGSGSNVKTKLNDSTWN